MQTQEEQERDLQDAQTYLSVTTLRADRCRHESVTETSIWVFGGVKDRRGNPIRDQQIGCIKRLPGQPQGKYGWEVTRMLNGQPVARKLPNIPCLIASAISCVTSHASKLTTSPG